MTGTPTFKELSAAHFAATTLEEFDRTSAELRRRAGRGDRGFSAIWKDSAQSHSFQSRSRETLERLASELIAGARDEKAKQRAIQSVRVSWVAARFSLVTLDRLLHELAADDNDLAAQYADQTYLDLRRKYYEQSIAALKRVHDSLADRLLSYCAESGYELGELREYFHWIDLEVMNRIPT